MSALLARRVASTPVRTTAETWAKIVELVAPDPQSAARKELAGVTGAACAAIASEALKDAPVVVFGGGPRIRIYCVFDEDAITNEGINEDALPKSPTEGGDWRISIPYLAEDVAWASAGLATASARIAARSVDHEVDDEVSDAAAAKSSLSINMSEFEKS
jgi:hypothetical protein